MCRIAGRLGSVDVSLRGVNVEIPAWFYFDPNPPFHRGGDSDWWAV